MIDYWINKYGVDGALEYFPNQTDPLFIIYKNQYVAAKRALVSYMIEQAEKHDDE